MDLENKLFSKNDVEVVENEVSEVPETLKITNYEQEPERAALIVNDSLEKGHYSEISYKLEELPSTGYKRVQYVFEGPDIKKNIWFILACLLFIMGYIYFFIIGIGLHLFSNDYENYCVLFLGVATIVFVVNIMLIVRSVRSIQYAKRYVKYYELLKYKNIEIIDDICIFTGIPYKTIVKDLSVAVRNKFIPQGHFTTNDLVFITSDELYSKYEMDKPIYDRYYKRLIEERIRMGERTDEMKKILDLGQEYIEKIHASNRLINDKDITMKLNQMEKIVTTIFREVDLNPSQADKLGMFLNYYLPTADKLLSAYVDISEKNNNGNNVKKAKYDIEHAIDMLIVSFGGILNQFYEAQEMDIASEVSAMENIMKQ